VWWSLLFCQCTSMFLMHKHLQCVTTSRPKECILGLG
jgi:hypothetical protein